MSEEKVKLIDRVENTARYLKAFACMARSIKTLAIAGVVLFAGAIVVPLGIKAYNTVNDIADMPGAMVDSAKGGIKSIWAHTGGAAYDWYKKDDNDAEVIDQVVEAEVTATPVEEVKPDSVEVTYEPEIEKDGGFGLCMKFWDCNKDEDESPEADIVPEEPNAILEPAMQ